MQNNGVIGLNLTLSGSKIEPVDTLGLSDPFLEIYRYDGDSKNGPPLWRTNMVKNTRSPEWEPFPFYFYSFQGITMMMFINDRKY